jgi:hypothetical protein
MPLPLGDRILRLRRLFGNDERDGQSRSNNAGDEASSHTFLLAVFI